MPAEPVARDDAAVRVPLGVVAREWLRIGLTGFGGPLAHIALLQRLVVERHGWMSAREFSDAVAACNLLPGPASTQLAIFCAHRLAGPARRDRRRPGLRRPRRAHRARPVGPVPGRRAARRRARGGRRGRSGGGRGRRRGGAGAARPRLGARARPPGAARPLARLPGRRDRGGRAHRALARARPARLRARRGRAADAPGRAALHRRARPRVAAAGGRGGRARRTGLDGVQGRRALLRRGLRDHPADAGRRRGGVTAG